LACPRWVERERGCDEPKARSSGTAVRARADASAAARLSTLAGRDSGSAQDWVLVDPNVSLSARGAKFRRSKEIVKSGRLHRRAFANSPNHAYIDAVNFPSWRGSDARDAIGILLR